MKGSHPSPRIVPVRGELADAVHAICATRVFLSRPERLSEDALEQASELMEGARDLARGVVLRALDHADAPSVAEVRASAGAQVEVLRDLAEAAAPSLVPASPDAVPADALGEAAALLLVAGLEHAEHDALLATEPEQGLVLVTGPVTRARCFVQLLEPLYDWIEEWVLDDELLSFERAAARWWFAQWTPPRRGDEHEFARGVREQEFALVARPFLGLDDRTAVEFLADAGELDDFPPKQRHLAVQLAESVPGLWEVVERDGDRTVLRSPLDGERFTVVEHAPEHGYVPGMLAAGRLIPFGDGTWLRSPGTVFLAEPEAGSAREFAEVVLGESIDVPPEARIEMLITTAAARTPLPRTPRPAPGVREAAEILERLRVALLEAGLAEEMPDDEVPPEVARAAAGAPGPIYDFQVDMVMGEWMAALAALALKGVARRQRREDRKKKAKKGRRRR